MTKHLQLITLSGLLVCLHALPGYAQESVHDPSSETAIDKASVADAELPASQEVEVNEDNYRQFMELRDARGLRNVLPENAFKPQSGLQKLDKLPEASQKHLRNQLREIIVQGDQWQPGDEATNYPYVASEAASDNPSLKNQEAEAWGELVDSYHKREAEIYARALQSEGPETSASARATGMGQGNGQANAGAGSGEAQAQAGQAGQLANQQRQQAADDGYAPSSASDSDAKSTAGVSQNAMEFLQKLGGLANNQSANGEGGSAPANDGQGDTQTQAAQQADTGQNRIAGATGEGSSQPSEADNTEGNTQNALEFLQSSENMAGNEGNGASVSSAGSEGQTGAQGDVEEGAGQAGSEEQNRMAGIPLSNPDTGSSAESATESTAGTSQNAKEYLQGEAPGSSQAMQGTANGVEADILSIEDLLNVQGIHGSAGVGASPKPSAQRLPGEKPDEDDSDG